MLKLKITEESMPIMGKLAQGSTIIKLMPFENVIGGITIRENQNADIILISQNGSVIKHALRQIRLCEKGDLGVMGINFQDSENIRDRIVQVYNGNQLAGIRTSLGKNGRVSANQIQEIEYNQIQVKAFNLIKDELITKVIPLLEKNTYKI